ncbi:MAG: hypothetical protein IKL68_05310 [Clostridia bacterium]|nr:hypothetical protein [Clostridia bacterium]
MKKTKKSGAALLIDIIIEICVLIMIACFLMYYTGYFKNGAVLYTGVTAFTIVYQLGLRLEFGVITTKFKEKLSTKQFLFKERKFEQKLYRILKVKKWKPKALTYDPDAFNLKKNTKEQVLQTMLKSELDHWINELISLSTLLFALIWGEFAIFLVTCILAMLFDAQFILIQRFNRPRIERLINKEKRIKAKKKTA